MKIVLRGGKVKTKLIQKCLSQTETDTYRSTWAVSLISYFIIPHILITINRLI